MGALKVDVGGGRIPQPGHVNLDPVHGSGVWQRRVQDGIPAADGSVTRVYASHVLEHVEVSSRIPVFNDVHRVLQPGGEFEVIVPLFPSWQAVADPTHVSFWVEQSFLYFTGALTAQADYGIRLWQLADWRVDGGWEGHALLVKPL